MTKTTTVLMVGVGGQGTILAADILAKVAHKSGYKVKLSEVHGMAQRGGSVSTIVKFGEEVFSPVTDPGQVDALVAFEVLEAQRSAHFVKSGGSLYVNDELMRPTLVAVGMQEIAGDPRAELAKLNPHFIPAQHIASELGSPRSSNIVLLGALSNALPFSVEDWEEVIAGRVPPKTREANLAAFARGRNAGIEA